MRREFSLPDIVSGIINFIFGLIMILLVVRLLLRLFGANVTTPFVQFIYNSSSSLLEPFRGIFSPVVIDTTAPSASVLETSTLVAIVFYLIVAYLIDAFIDFIAYQSKRYR
jgi:uncharacterized protein YggT (Ycf19 family)